jgi:hypothetical protein
MVTVILVASPHSTVCADTEIKPDRVLFVTTIEQDENSRYGNTVTGESSEPPVYYGLSCSDDATKLEVGQSYRVAKNVSDGKAYLAFVDIQDDPHLAAWMACEIKLEKIIGRKVQR